MANPIWVTELSESLRCVPIEKNVGEQAGRFLRQHAKSHRIEIADALSAASAAVTGAEIWTRNRKHFPMKDLSFF